MCPNCEEWKETVEHFLEQCPAKALLRGNIFYNHYMTSRDIFKRYSLTTITKFIRLTNRFSDPDNLDQSGVTSCCLCSSPLALLVSHPLSSLHLAALSSTLLSYFPLLVTRARQNFFVAVLLWALRSAAPLKAKKWNQVWWWKRDNVVQNKSEGWNYL